MSTLSQFLGGGGIKSIQRGTTEFMTSNAAGSSYRTTLTIPITPVVKSKTMVLSSVAGDVMLIEEVSGGGAYNSTASLKLKDGISYVGGTTELSGTSTNGDISLSDLESGDFVLLFMANDDRVLTSPGFGWTGIPFNPFDPNPDNDNAPSSSGYYTFAGSNGVVTANVPSNSNQCMIAFRGVNTSTPFDVSPIPRGNRRSNRLPDPPAITTVNDKCMIVAVGFLNNKRLVRTTTIPPFTYNLGEVVSSRDSSTIMTAYKKQIVAGPENPSEFRGTDDDNTNDVNKGFTIALRPVAPIETSSALEITVGRSGMQSGVVDWQVIEYK
jgi:hypothetical protein